jgi:hypothetical protein
MASDDWVRMTVRLPSSAARFLDDEARENFTSRNAEIVRAVRTAMKTKSPAGTAIPPGQRSPTNFGESR